MLGVDLINELVRIKGWVMKYLMTFFWFVIAFIVVIFTVLNSDSLTINFYVGTVSVYFPLVLLIFLLIGSVLGLFALVPVLVRSKQKNTKLKDELRMANKELKNLRTMPINE